MNFFFWRKKPKKRGRPKKVREGNIAQRRRSPRTDEVLVFIGQGLANKQIADRMGIKEDTVKTYVFQLFQEFDTESRIQLVVKALKNGDLKIEEL